MNQLDSFLKSVLTRGIAELTRKQARIYTFAFYHDHESDALSVCADSEANSRRAVRDMNQHSMKHFMTAVRKGDLAEASVWQPSIGRNLSLGDFKWVNLARTPLEKFARSPKLHTAMVGAALSCTSKLLKLASDRDSLLVTCSTADEEVGLVWFADAKLKAPRRAS